MMQVLVRKMASGQGIAEDAVHLVAAIVNRSQMFATDTRINSGFDSVWSRSRFGTQFATYQCRFTQECEWKLM